MENLRKLAVELGENPKGLCWVKIKRLILGSPYVEGAEIMLNRIIRERLEFKEKERRREVF